MRLVDCRTSLGVLMLLAIFHSPAPAAAADAPPGARRATADRGPEANAVKFTVTLSTDEHRKTADAARQDVLDKAQKRVVAWLRELCPDTRWEPSLKMLTERGILHHPRTEKSQLVADVGKELYTASVEVVLTPSDQEYLLREVRLAEAVERQWGSTRLFFAIVVLLGALAGYYWFDELSKGYYTQWLRVGLAGVLIAAGFLIIRLPHLRNWLATP